MLQWGRGLGTAERLAPGSATAGAAALSWGRGLGSAEGPSSCSKAPSGHELQWGRGLWTAESAHRGWPDDRRSDASMGPRSWDRGERPSIAGVGDTAGQLQWGRGLGTAESIALIRIALTWHALQWGRGLGTAERARHRRSKISQRRSFNRAAVLGPRRGAGAHPCSLLENTASMGPRSWDRGEPRAT